MTRQYLAPDTGRLNVKIMQNKIDERRESTFHRDIVTTMNRAHQR